MRVETLTDAALDDALDAVAQLRISVFAAFPYLYDGDLAYERRYLESYRKSPRAILVGAFEGDTLVGAATGTPLADHKDDFAQAFAGSGIALEDVFYCAESVLLPQWRGHGIGHRFFDLREDHARTHGFSHCAFCAVIRPDDHPGRPADYRPLDGFWRKRGYEEMPGVMAHFSWKDVGDTAETRKPLQFWIRRL